jgi:hypothetical protein
MKVTSAPPLARRAPKKPPTPPEPMIAMRKSASVYASLKEAAINTPPAGSAQCGLIPCAALR